MPRDIIREAEDLLQYPKEFTFSSKGKIGLMTDPVIVVAGKSMERKEVEKSNDRTNRSHLNDKLIPNHNLKKAITTYRDNTAKECLYLIDELLDSNELELANKLLSRAEELSAPLNRKDLKQEIEAKYVQIKEFANLSEEQRKEICTKKSKLSEENNQKRKAKLFSMVDDLKEDPNEFCCPISLKIIVSSAVTASGHSYEEKEVATWINNRVIAWKNDTTLPIVDPSTGQDLGDNTSLMRNQNLDSAINNYRENKIKKMFSIAEEFFDLGESEAALEINKQAEKLIDLFNEQAPYEKIVVKPTETFSKAMAEIDMVKPNPSVNSTYLRSLAQQSTLVRDG